jgi:uncharacterized membrane protein YqiK
METLISAAIFVGIAIVVMFGIGAVFTKLYKRATKEMAFVRTGLGGQKVIMDGGALVLPIFHELIHVNMNTLKLEVKREHDTSISTKDRMRVDVVAAFFVRVAQKAEAISSAAQTLGQRTKDPAQLKTLIEDKFVDALRAASVTMTMKELQDKRQEFVMAVQKAVAGDLEKNGLELESVSMTKLDQTDKKYFNPSNAFDAEGLTRLTEETEARRRERNSIEKDTEVQVETKNLEAKRKTLELAKESDFASQAQKREIANNLAEQTASIAQVEALRTREANEARIEAEKAVRQKQIEADRAVAESEIDKKLKIQSREIEAKQATEVLSAQQRREVEIAQQDTQIAISNKSREQSVADASANKALAEAVVAEQEVVTAREVATAEREKQIVLINAAQAAEQLAIGVKTAAKAEREAADDRAQAITVEATAKRDAALAEAAGIEAILEAKNKLSPAQINMQIDLERLRILPEVMAQAVKPIEKIESIRIVQVAGMPGTGNSTSNGSTGSSTGSGSGQSLPDQVVDAALGYQVGKQLVASVMSGTGLDALTVEGMMKPLLGSGHNSNDTTVETVTHSE